MSIIVEPNSGVGHTAIEYLPGSIRVHIDIEDANPEEVFIDIQEDSIEVCAPMHEAVALEEVTLDKEGMIYRSIPLPQGIDAESMEISTEDGHFDIIMQR